MIVAQSSTLLQKLNLTEKLGIPAETLEILLESLGGKSTSSVSTYVGKTKLILATVPETVSRNNHPWSVHAITKLVSTHVQKGSGGQQVIFVGEDAVDYQGPLTLAVAKAFSLYSRKTTSSSSSKEEDLTTTTVEPLQIAFWNAQGETVSVTNDAPASQVALAAAAAVQWAGRWVDMPPAELTTDVYAAEIQSLVAPLEGVTFREIVGTDLDEQGYGGIYGVGKAATCPPRLVILEYTPPTLDENAPHVCLVGKGIVYDTGGLSLKPKTGMCGMKGDMGGSAGVLGGFLAAVQSGHYPHKLTLLLCLAENAIGPTAFRNDDILQMYSGKTVEVNNCDAEGRLVLGDGVAHATKHIDNLSLIVDMATLTGAQMVATGQTHAGILANTPALETRAVQAGLQSGDLVFPLLYAPELLMKEFDSKVADMKNSVKDRSNAQTSCAGHFIEAHLDEGYQGEWLHVDMAGPSELGERGTGYGVGLVLSLLQVPGF